MIRPNWIKTNTDRFPKGEWFVEFFTKGEFHAHQIKKFINSYKTEFQTAVLVETHSFGKLLIIDRETQSSELDEFIYHQSLVLPAIIFHPNPRKFAILGGGEGATLREVLSYKKTESVVMVDIDYNILRFAKKYLHSWHKGSFNDKRVTLLSQDAKTFIENTKLKFDIIYSDLSSPIKGGPAYKLYTLEFYRTLKTKLNDGGIFVTQAGPGHILQLELHPAIYKTLSKVFKYVYSYLSFIPSYDMPWSYIIASDRKIEMNDTNIRLKFEMLKNKPKYLDHQNIKTIFTSIPYYFKDAIDKNRKIIRDTKPLFFSTSRY
jgi:spermidine synthase